MKRIMCPMVFIVDLGLLFYWFETSELFKNHHCSVQILLHNLEMSWSPTSLESSWYNQVYKQCTDDINNINICVYQRRTGMEEHAGWSHAAAVRHEHMLLQTWTDSTYLFLRKEISHFISFGWKTISHETSRITKHHESRNFTNHETVNEQ